MKRRFWARLIAAMLTMAMVFSILAVPASATDGADGEEIKIEIDTNGNWAVRTRLDEVTSISRWDARNFYIYTNPMDEDELAAMLQDAYDNGNYVEGVPEDAFRGFSKEDGQIYWFDAEQTRWIVEQLQDELDEDTGLLKNFVTIDKGMDWETGALTLKGETIVALNGDFPSDSDTSAAVVLAVAGTAAVAAATGVYFYTHPEKVEEVKAFFADLSVKVQDAAANVKEQVLRILPGQEKAETELVTGPAAEIPAA